MGSTCAHEQRKGLDPKNVYGILSFVAVLATHVRRYEAEGKVHILDFSPV